MLLAAALLLSHATLAVDGPKMVRNLPVLLADHLGYFRDAGLDLTLQDTSANPKTDAQLVTGEVVGMAAFYHHTIVAQMEEHLAVEAVITLAAAPGYQVLVTPAAAERFHSAQDLKGARIITGGPHSAKTTVANWLVMHGGFAATDYRRLATAGADKIIAALKSGEADLVVAPEPDASRYLDLGVAQPFADLYSTEGTRRSLGSVFPSSVVYMSTAYVRSHPEVTQALVNALARSLGYLRTHSLEEVRRAVPDVMAGDAKDPRVLAQGVKMFATDGRMPRAAAAMEAKVVAVQFPAYAGVNVDATFTNAFVDRAPARGP